MENAAQGKKIPPLPVDRFVLPGDERWNSARRPFNPAIDQRPDAVALPRSEAEVAEVVRFAVEHGLQIAPQLTGHGALPLGSLEGVILLRTDLLQGVEAGPTCSGPAWRRRQLRSRDGARVRVVSLSHLQGGTLFFPWERTGEVLHRWCEWVDGVPDEMTSNGRVMQFPALPQIPDPLRGRSFVQIEAVHTGPDADAQELIEPLRRLGPVLDTFHGLSPLRRMRPSHGPSRGAAVCRRAPTLGQARSRPDRRDRGLGRAGVRITDGELRTPSPRRRPGAPAARAWCPRRP
jgi:hypothetical protein